MKLKNKHSIIGIGIFSSILASLCCIIPVIAIIAGIGGFASSFTWIEPFRPYIIGFTVIILGIGFFQAYTPSDKKDCCDDNCKTSKKTTFNNKYILWIVTLVCALFISFPYYSGYIFSNNINAITPSQTDNNNHVIEVAISGMTCTGCELYIKEALLQDKRINSALVSYNNKNAIIEYNSEKITPDEILLIINNTGYRAISYQNIKSDK